MMRTKMMRTKIVMNISWADYKKIIDKEWRLV